MTTEIGYQRALRAQVRNVIRTRSTIIIGDGIELLRVLHPQWPDVPLEEALSPSLRNGLRAAAAWHSSRTTAAKRLRALEEEIKRLAKREPEGSSKRRVFLARLHRLIWPQPNMDEDWRKIDQALNDQQLPTLWTDVEQTIALAPADRERWQAELRLALALAVLDTLNALYDTRMLQRVLSQQEGGWEWL